LAFFHISFVKVGYRSLNLIVYRLIGGVYKTKSAGMLEKNRGEVNSEWAIVNIAHSLFTIDNSYL